MTPTEPFFDASDLAAARAYDYVLPEARIAQEPAAERDGSRLLVARQEGLISDHMVRDLSLLLEPGDLLIFNDTRVMAARLEGVRAATGGRAEFLALTLEGPRMKGLLKTRGTALAGETFVFGAGLTLRSVAAVEEGRAILELTTGSSAMEALDRHGRMPLPPYIRRARGGDERDALDRARYQTEHARNFGAAAAPTAGLHFTASLREALHARGIRFASITLHTGLGTFKPLSSENLDAHVMHEEVFTVPPETAAAYADCRARGGSIVAVGTTVLRALETVASGTRERGVEITPQSGCTRLFLRSPAEVRSADRLFTNFHAPRSTLLVLLSAFAGHGMVRDAYAHALNGPYRFLSYGDATLFDNRCRAR